MRGRGFTFPAGDSIHNNGSRDRCECSPLTFPVAWSQSYVYTEFPSPQISPQTTTFALAVHRTTHFGSGCTGAQPTSALRVRVRAHRLTWATICDPGTACIGRQGSDGVLPGLSPSNRVRGRVWGSLRYLRTAWGVVTVVRESVFLSPGRFVPSPLVGDVVWGISRCMRRNEVDL